MVSRHETGSSSRQPWSLGYQPQPLGQCSNSILHREPPILGAFLVKGPGNFPWEPTQSKRSLGAKSPPSSQAAASPPRSQTSPASWASPSAQRSHRNGREPEPRKGARGEGFHAMNKQKKETKEPSGLKGTPKEQKVFFENVNL